MNLKKSKLSKIKNQIDDLFGDKGYQKIQDVEVILMKVRDDIEKIKSTNESKDKNAVSQILTELQLKAKIDELIVNNKEFNAKIKKTFGEFLVSVDKVKDDNKGLSDSVKDLTREVKDKINNEVKKTDINEQKEHLIDIKEQIGGVKDEIVDEFQRIEIPNQEKQLTEIGSKIDDILVHNKNLKIIDYKSKIDEMIVSIRTIKEDYRKVLQEVISSEVNRVMEGIKKLTVIANKDRYGDVLKKILGNTDNLVSELGKLRKSIDSKVTGSGVKEITVGNEEPQNPEIGDLWVDTTR